MTDEWWLWTSPESYKWIIVNIMQQIFYSLLTKEQRNTEPREYIITKITIFNKTAFLTNADVSW